MQSHEAWLSFAQEDLKAAKGLLPLELFSTVTYHSQQCAEKSLKTYLVFKRHQMARTHDLLQLLELCMKFDKDFEKMLEAADTLNPFSVKFRYPSEFDIPDIDIAKTTIKQAQKILNFVMKKMYDCRDGQSKIFDNEEPY